jgi:outer membrane murein-binding lipoprotein Lpp
MPISPMALFALAALATAFAAGHHVASTSSDASRLAGEKAALENLVGTMAQRLVTINEAATADAARATADAQRLAKLQELIDAIPDDGNVCLPASSAERLRNIR